jgi:hypothetical protein
MFKQVVYCPEGSQEFLVPPSPESWRVIGGATVIRYLGKESLSPEFIDYALALGWRFSPENASFYPIEPDSSVF